MKKLKLKESIKILTTIVLILFSISGFNINAQESATINFGDIENLQDQNMDYLKQIHRIIKNYPAFSYTYRLEDDKVKNVVVSGVNNELDQKRLEVILFDLKSNKNMLKSKASRIGVFYSADTEPVYKQGHEALQSEIYKNLKYPKDAKNWGVEGTVFVKFVVDENGTIPFASTSEDIETSIDSYVDDLERQAVKAIKATSGDWNPGTIDGVKVPTLAVLPITFDFRKSPALPTLIR